MALTLAIPEAAALRRLAASLSSALATGGAPDGLNLDLSASHFFRAVPWSGQRRQVRRKAEPLEATTGQYFADFNWDGVPIEGGLRSAAPAPPASRSNSAEFLLSRIFDQD